MLSGKATEFTPEQFLARFQEIRQAFETSLELLRNVNDQPSEESTMQKTGLSHQVSGLRLSEYIRTVSDLIAQHPSAYMVLDACNNSDWKGIKYTGGDLGRFISKDAGDKPLTFSSEAKSAFKIAIVCTRCLVHGPVLVSAPAKLPFLDFWGTHFDSEVVLDGVELLRGADLWAVQFEGLRGGISLCGSTVHQPGLQVRLLGDGGYLRLRSASFYGPLLCVQSTILAVDTEGAVFKEMVSLSTTFIKEDANFARASFEGDAFFFQTFFRREANFFGANFHASATFREASFAIVPRFHEAKIHGDASFFQAEFSLPPLEARKLSHSGDADRNAYRTLRMAMRKIGALEDEARFFSLEQRAGAALLRWREEPLEKLLSKSYGVVSDYGNSAGRALAAFAVWNLAFAILFNVLMHSTFPLGWGYEFGIPAEPPALFVAPDSIFAGGSGATGLAVQNAVNPLALVSERPLIHVQNGSLFMLSLVQAIGSLSIVTLFLLAIRSRFVRGGSGSA